MFYLIYFADLAQNVDNFLSRTKLISPLFEEICIKKLFCDFCLDKLAYFQNNKILYQSMIFYGIFQSENFLI